MKKTVILALAAAILFSASAPAAFSPPGTSAEAMIVLHAGSGAVLAEKNADTPMLIASTTKLMTALTALDLASPERSVTVQSEWTTVEGSSMYLRAGESYTLRELLEGLLLASGNDAALAIAGSLGGDAFIEQMNRKAAELGMSGTHFCNACGLDEAGHLSTARDVAVMSREMLNRHPQITRYTTIWMDSLRGGATQLLNTNKLLKRYSGITGLKTGTTGGAGVCISASATRDGLDLIAVVLGSLSSSERFTAATTLLDYGFAAYAAVPLPAMEDRPLLIKVKGSAEESVPLDYTALPETLLMPKENAAALTAQLDLPQELEAPVQLGQTVGTVRILSGETQLGEYEVRAAADAEKMDFGTAFGLLWDALTGCES